MLFRSEQFTQEVLPELATIQAHGAIRVVDLLYIEKTDDGAVVLTDVDQLAQDSPTIYDGLADGLEGLFSQEDIDQIAERIPAGMSAFVMLFEHVWTAALRDAIDRAGGAVLGGGMAEPEALVHLEAEFSRQTDPDSSQ